MIRCAIACEKVTLLSWAIVKSSLALARGGLAKKNWCGQLEQMQQIRPGMVAQGVSQMYMYVYLHVAE